MRGVNQALITGDCKHEHWPDLCSVEIWDMHSEQTHGQHIYLIWTVWFGMGNVLTYCTINALIAYKCTFFNVLLSINKNSSMLLSSMARAGFSASQCIWVTVLCPLDLFANAQPQTLLYDSFSQERNSWYSLHICHNAYIILFQR